MEYAVSSFCRIDMPLVQALPLLNNSTSTQIEIFCEAPHLAMDGDWRSDLRLLRDYAQRNAVQYALHAPCFDLNPAAANAGVRAEVERQYRWAIECAHELGASHVVIHSGHRSDPRLDAAQARDWTRALLERLVPQAEYAHVKLALENTGYGAASIIHTPEDLLTLVDDLPDASVGLTLDIGHAALQGLAPEPTVAVWVSRLCNVHLHDNGGHEDDHWVPGCGLLPLNRWLDALQQCGYTGALTMEAYLGGPGPVTVAAAWSAIAES